MGWLVLQNSLDVYFGISYLVDVLIADFNLLFAEKGWIQNEISENFDNRSSCLLRQAPAVFNSYVVVNGAPSTVKCLTQALEDSAFDKSVSNPDASLAEVTDNKVLRQGACCHTLG